MQSFTASSKLPSSSKSALTSSRRSLAPSCIHAGTRARECEEGTKQAGVGRWALGVGGGEDDRRQVGPRHLFGNVAENFCLLFVCWVAHGTPHPVPFLQQLLHNVGGNVACKAQQQAHDQQPPSRFAQTKQAGSQTPHHSFSRARTAVLTRCSRHTHALRLCHCSLLSGWDGGWMDGWMGK